MMCKIYEAMKKLREKGQGIVEYVVVIAVAAALAAYVFGEENDLKSSVKGNLSKASSNIDDALKPPKDKTNV